MTYIPHPCLICRELTTNKTYCDKDLKIIKKPPWSHRSTKPILADMEFSKSGQRRENEHILRG